MSDRAAVRLAFLRLLGRLLPANASAVHWPPRILVLRPDHIGDLLFLYPALAELRSLLPEASITLAVGPWTAPLAELNRAVDHVEVIAFPGFQRQPNPGLLAPYVQALRLARKWRGKFDFCLISRRDHWWGAMTASLAGLPRVWGWQTPETEPFLTCSLTMVPGLHEVAANVRLVRLVAHSLGRSNGDDEPTPQSHPLRLDLPASIEAKVKTWLRQNVGTDRGFVCLHPGAGAPNKVWPQARYQSLLRSLARHSQAPILVTGTLAEAESVTKIAAASSMAIPAAGEFGLAELAAVLGRAVLAVGSDSGPLHLAVARGTPTVHIYGPADETRFGPWGTPERHRILAATVHCRPCNDLWHCSSSDSLACMRGVSMEEVLWAVVSLLGKSGTVAPP